MPKSTRGQEEPLSKNWRLRLQQGESKGPQDAIPSRDGVSERPRPRSAVGGQHLSRALLERRAELAGRARPPDSPGIHCMTHRTRRDELALSRKCADADLKNGHFLCTPALTRASPMCCCVAFHVNSRAQIYKTYMLQQGRRQSRSCAHDAQASSSRYFFILTARGAS